MFWALEKFSPLWQSIKMISEIVDIADIDPGGYLRNWESHAGTNGLSSSGLTNIELATLGELMGAGEYDELVEQFTIEAETDTGSVLLSLPESIAKQLSALAASEVPTLAALWAGTDELRGRTSDAAVAEFILNLKTFVANSQRPKLLLIV